MTAPRLEIRLDQIQQNTATLVGRLRSKGIGVTGVTKATLGSPEVAAALVRGGVSAIGDSRVENLESMRRAGISAPMTLLRSPMPSQVRRVVAVADVSLNTEPEVLALLSATAVALGRTHRVVLMVELGDLREGILPGDLDAVARSALELPGIELVGIGTNLACQSGVTPDARNMAELSALATGLEAAFGIRLDVVSGGNSANLDWVAGGGPVGRINDLRIGEAILLGCEPLHRRRIEGLHDAFTLVGEVIESKRKPSVAWGDIEQSAFGAVPPAVDRGDTGRVIVALGRQDVDPAGLTPPPGLTVIGASSDHLLLDAGTSTTTPAVGAEIRFQLSYGALLAAMTSPFVAREHVSSHAQGDAAGC